MPKKEAKLNPTGVAHESNFWKGFINSHRFAEWCDQTTKTPDLNNSVYGMVKLMNPEKVLDVGSGPVSIFIGTLPVNSIVTCDPLSEHYQKMFDYANSPFPAPEPYLCEKLPEQWKEKFDLVHISNALDHTVDPILSARMLSRCVSKGGRLMIQGFTNEAIHENYQGFHQWNLDLVDNSIVVTDKDQKVTYLTGDSLGLSVRFAHKEVNQLGREWFIWVAEKLATGNAM